MSGVLARAGRSLTTAARAQLPSEVISALESGGGRLDDAQWHALTPSQRSLIVAIRERTRDGLEPPRVVQAPEAASTTHLVGTDPLGSVAPGADPVTGNDPHSMEVLFGNVVDTRGLACFEGQALLDELKSRFYSTHVTLSYRQAREALFGRVDNFDGKVTDVYTGRTIVTQGIPSPDGSEGMNTEHTWPQSDLKTQGKQAAISDLHHLFATDTEANGRRGSYPFGTVVREIWKSGESRLGTDVNGKMVFEPPPLHRGNVARALFWIATAYDLDIPPDEEAELRRWAATDPSDETERQRNLEVRQEQGDLNPFVIDATLPDRVPDF
jgi:deoxyribonuclease I